MAGRGEGERERGCEGHDVKSNDVGTFVLEATYAHLYVVSQHMLCFRKHTQCMWADCMTMSHSPLGADMLGSFELFDCAT